MKDNNLDDCTYVGENFKAGKRIGCGKYVEFWNKNCGDIESLKHSEHIVLCDDCLNKDLEEKK